jgi:hypothetical protein
LFIADTVRQLGESSVKSRIAVLAAGAVAALAAAPAASQAAPPDPGVQLSQPPNMCFETVQFAVCSDDAGPLAQRAISDPAGTTAGLAGLAVRIVCDSTAYVTCEITS